MRPIADLTGKKFNNWTVVRISDRDNFNAVKWLCRCDCGTERSVRATRLTRGTSKSCGCLREKIITKHGMERTRLYCIWKDMKVRCLKENDKSYRNYGGRGISLCPEWQEFIPFMEWAMESGYSDGLQIDRVDNDGHYVPENCRWVTPRVNARNRRTNRLITIEGVTKTLIQWSEGAGISIQVLSYRIKRGWNESELLIPTTARTGG